ncbi:glycerol-3-phosphate dehydrogenase [Quadrisphaera sp. DSM 44207]|uniref:glycerol-3-phosphate dehydrogenase n=1 Tax=Quadrisphaera sp. DSM 44207 TaxID=1881057 RepID=UPI00087FBF94|nr:glycerol-3-phosphate dehydrogenase [Quadrisphaera sp. DSM 44207]SDQ83432.1 glycerol-3-phosphate dehydrogenase [Quadrisphaera sp. DSM 44207]
MSAAPGAGARPPAVDELSAPFDVVVVGAGINGLGIARDAALRGLRVALLEQDDLCSGVSAWSGRLVHGGLRYLEHYEVGLVRESLRERELLFRVAPHLVEPVRLMMPFYRHNKRPGWMIRLGMVLYDVLSFDKKSPSHRILSLRETVERFTGINRDGLSGAALFTDGQVEAAERLCVELAVAAVGDGAVIRTRARVEEVLVEGGRVQGVRFVDTRSGEVGEVRAPVVYNVAGPWIDRVFRRGAPEQPRLNGGTKGSHLVVDPFPGAPADVVYYESRRDGRLVLVIPWMQRYLIGTTDIRFEEDPVQARCDADEMAYMLNEVNSLVPGANLTQDDVLYTYSGVRPLPYAPGVPESKVTRTHVLHDHGPQLQGLVTVVGGKLSTYRQLAEDAVDDVFTRLGRKAPPCVTQKIPFPGAVGDRGAVRAALLSRAGLSERTADRLLGLYGARAADVVACAAGDPELLEVFDPESGAIGAELLFAVRRELAVSLADVMARRVLLAFQPGHGLETVDRAAAVLGDRLGWDEERQRAEVAGYRQWLERLAVPGRAADPAPAGARR